MFMGLMDMIVAVQILLCYVHCTPGEPHFVSKRFACLCRRADLRWIKMTHFVASHAMCFLDFADTREDGSF